MSVDKLLAWDSGSGYTEGFHVLAGEEDTFLISEIQECDNLIRQAKALSDQKPDHDFRHAAFIPQAIYNKAAREGWLNDKKAWKKWANDPANKLFRTWPGRL